eukprot:gene1462-2812_t
MTISSHILDTSTGVPARNMRVIFERNVANNFTEFDWLLLSETTSNNDGRCPGIMEKCTQPLQTGVYRMKFFTQDYFASHGVLCFYPVVDVIFRITDPATHYHIPLLISPYGYSTYRGS